MEIKNYGPLPDFDGGSLNKELWLEIFLRSSIGTVARFRAVSKTWHAFLCHNNFRQLYKRVFFLDEDEDLLVISGSVSGDRKCLMSVKKTPFHDYDVRLIGLPVCASEMIMVGSCDGLICLSDNPQKMEKILLWNPSIAEEKLIEAPPSKLRQKSIGIGYANMHEYKIIRLIGLEEAKFHSLVQLYSVNEDVWKDCITIPFYPDGNASSFNIGGVPYWVGYDTRVKNVICSFDPTSEVYEKIEYPPRIRAADVYPVNLRDRVSALVVCKNKLIDVYNFEESSFTWVKKITTGKLHIQLDFVRKLHCYKDSGDVVALGWPDSEITVNDVSNDGVLSHLSMKIGTVLFTPDYTGPFAHTGINNAKIPGGKKVLEAQPRPDGKFWNLRRAKENVAAHPESKPTLVNKVLVDGIEALDGRSLGSYSEIALSPLARLFHGNKKVPELALEELVHLSEQSDLAAKMVRMDMVGNSMEMLCLEGVGFTKLLVKLLVNLTRVDDGVKSLLKSCNDEKMHGLNVVKLVSLFSTSTKDTKGDAFEDAGSILVNISRSDAGRKLLLEPERGLIKEILKEFDSASPVRRKGVSGTIFNCCFGLEAEHQLENLLMASEFLWPTLLLPIAGKKAYSEEETSKMPLALGSTLLVERKVAYDAETQIEALEAIYLIALQERGLRALRSVNGELILEVGAACERNPEVIEAYELVGSLLLQGSEPATLRIHPPSP